MRYFLLSPSNVITGRWEYPEQTTFEKPAGFGREEYNWRYTVEVSKAGMLMKLKGLVNHSSPAVDLYLEINWFCINGIQVVSSLFQKWAVQGKWSLEVWGTLRENIFKDSENKCEIEDQWWNLHEQKNDYGNFWFASILGSFRQFLFHFLALLWMFWIVCFW